MTTTAPVRPELPPLPDRMKHLPVDHRGYPVPFFVAWPDGVPDHRIADPAQLAKAVRLHLCHLCGQRLGSYLAFVLGPMCVVNRTSSELPDHRECAEWAMRACPFLSRPKAHRRDAQLPDGVQEAAGMPIQRNPGVAILYITRRFYSRPEAPGLWRLGDPLEIVAYAEGRLATAEEIAYSFDTGVPALLQIAEQQGPEAVTELEARITEARTLLGIPAPAEGQPARAP